MAKAAKPARKAAADRKGDQRAAQSDLPVRGPAAGATRRTRLEVDERRAQLLELGLKAFSASPYDEVLIDDVARAAGISKGLLYHYFPTKRDFYLATLGVAAQQLLDETLTDPEMPPQVRLEHGVTAYLRYVERFAPAYAALMRGGIGSDPAVAGIVDQTRLRFVERLLEGAPMARPSPVLRTTLRGWVGLVEAASLDWLDQRDLTLEALRDLLVRLLVAALVVAQQAQTEGPESGLVFPLR